MVRRRLAVHGTVQGVFFRASCVDVARAAGVAGWVANRADGTVEVVLEGEPDPVDGVVTWCRNGPSRAQVTDVDVVDESPEGLTDFRQR